MRTHCIYDLFLNCIRCMQHAVLAITLLWLARVLSVYFVCRGTLTLMRCRQLLQWKARRAATVALPWRYHLALLGEPLRADEVKAAIASEGTPLPGRAAVAT